VVPIAGEVNIFELQEKAIVSILRTAEEQIAREEAPRILNPIQQTIATLLITKVPQSSRSQPE
jgi:hypothetical protein